MRLEPPAHGPVRPSTTVIAGAIVALIAFATAAVLLASDSEAATGRIALLFGLLGLTVPVLLGSLKSDQAATQTNGHLDKRIHDAVIVALANRAAETPRDRAEDRPAPAPIDLAALPPGTTVGSPGASK